MSAKPGLAQAPTFPLSAWATFIDSRMAFRDKQRKYVLRAILEGNSTAYSLPGPMALVRKKVFGGNRVLSKEEFEALKLAFSGGQLISKLQQTREGVLKRASRNPSLVREYAAVQEDIEKEVKTELNERIKALSRSERAYKEKVDLLTKRISDLERDRKKR
jgi:hypothetical protein